MLRRAILVCSLMIAAGAAGTAQPVVPPPYERPDLWTVVQDSIIVSLVDAVDTVPPNMISGAYTFSMLYDSTCRTDYVFTEPWLNGNRLALDHWFSGRSVNVDEAMLSFNSRTKNFKASAGDTLRFYREIDWINPVTSRQDTTNFFSRDTLGFSVELVRSYDMGRIVLLDSIGIMPQNPPGKMRFYAPHNAMAVVQYVIPSWIDKDSLCMRVRVYARGSGEYYFTRFDNIKSNYSASVLTHPVLQSDLAILEQCCWTPITLPEQQESLGKALLKAGEEGIAGPGLVAVRQAEAGDAAATLRITPAPELGPLSIIIADAHGNTNMLFSGSIEAAQELSYRFPSSGVYIIGVVRDGKVIETTTITVTR